MSSIQELLRAALIPLDEAQLLLAWLLNKDRSWLFAWGEQTVPAEVAEQFTELTAQRAAGTPIAYLTGEREFWSLSLRVTPDTLIPRPETEHLVEQTLQAGQPQSPLRVLDLGTGSGAIALALAHARPHWEIHACDRSPGALAVAQSNAARLGLKLHCLQSNWFDAIEGHFDLIVSNPPYIRDDDPHLDQGDLRFEPRSALTAGPDGLSDIRHIIARAPAFLAPEGQLLIEHGYDHAPALRQLFNAAGYQAVHSTRDLAGHERITQGISPT